MNKNLIIATVVVATALGAALPAAAYAQSGNASIGKNNSIVDKIANKFNLNKDEVKKVFEENRAEHQAKKNITASERLATLVSEGKITQSQADKITAKRAEIKASMESNREAMHNKTKIERKEAMEAKKTELEKWASDNGIDSKFLLPNHPKDGPREPKNDI